MSFLSSVRSFPCAFPRAVLDPRGQKFRMFRETKSLIPVMENKGILNMFQHLFRDGDSLGHIDEKDLMHVAFADVVVTEALLFATPGSRQGTREPQLRGDTGDGNRVLCSTKI